LRSKRGCSVTAGSSNGGEFPHSLGTGVPGRGAGPLRWRRPSGRMMAEPSLRVLALVTDAFGGHGGIAQYNRDFLAALAACEGIHVVIVLPRASEKSPGTLPSGVRQLPPVQGRLAYSLAALQAAQAHPAIDVVFCGHLFMAPLAATISKFLRVPLW